MILGEAILLTKKTNKKLSMLNLKRVSMISVAGAFIALGAISLTPKSASSATLTITSTLESSSSSGIGNTLAAASILKDLDGISVILEGVLKLWGIVNPQGRPLEATDFTTIKSARLLVACVNNLCKTSQSKSNDLVSFEKETVEKVGEVASKALISGELKQTKIGKNPACVGKVFVDGLSPIKCEKEVDAVGRPKMKDTDIFVKNVTASVFGLVYDGRGGRLLIDGGEDIDEVWKSVPEPTSVISIIALSTLGAASTLKRKLKPSKSTEK